MPAGQSRRPARSAPARTRGSPSCAAADDESGDRLTAEIRVDDVRRLKDFFHLSATDGGRRVVIVDAADEMNPDRRQRAPEGAGGAARPHATLLLVAHQPSRLLPTIRSRCRELRLAPLSPEPISARALDAGRRRDRGARGAGRCSPAARSGARGALAGAGRAAALRRARRPAGRPAPPRPARGDQARRKLRRARAPRRASR